MDDQQERDIARGLQEGKAEAWRLLYEAYSEQVWRLVARLMGAGSAEVADVVQETFLAAARAARTYQPERGTLFAWLWGIARQHVALAYRKQQRHDHLRRAQEWLAASNGKLAHWLENREATPPEALETRELADLVRAALGELSDEYALLLVTRYLDDTPIEEIARRDHSTAGAVRSKLARARQAFRETFSRTSIGSPANSARG